MPLVGLAGKEHALPIMRSSRQNKNWTTSAGDSSRCSGCGVPEYSSEVDYAGRPRGLVLREHKQPRKGASCESQQAAVAIRRPKSHGQ